MRKLGWLEQALLDTMEVTRMKLLDSSRASATFSYDAGDMFAEFTAADVRVRLSLMVALHLHADL
jgi:hypothetical protein